MPPFEVVKIQCLFEQHTDREGEWRREMRSVLFDLILLANFDVYSLRMWFGKICVFDVRCNTRLHCSNCNVYSFNLFCLMRFLCDLFTVYHVLFNIFQCCCSPFQFMGQELPMPSSDWILWNNISSIFQLKSLSRDS